MFGKYGGDRSDTDMPITGPEPTVPSDRRTVSRRRLPARAWVRPGAGSSALPMSSVYRVTALAFSTLFHRLADVIRQRTAANGPFISLDAPGWPRPAETPAPCASHPGNAASVNGAPRRHDDVPIVVCDAKEADMPAILTFGASDHHWEDCTAGSIFLVAKLHDRIVGFTFCKPLSPSWAMLDSMYVAPEYRKTRAATLLYEELLFRLHALNIKYISTLAEVNDTTTQAVIRRHGFKAQKTYVWYDKTLKT